MKVTIYSNEDVAKRCNCSIETAKKYAQKNDISFLGGGHRKTYVWFEEDIEKFMTRDTKRGRRWYNTSSS